MKQEEFIQLVSEHSGIIHKILYLYVDDPEDKADLKQEIMVQAWSAVGRFRKEATFSTWLYRIALNTVLTFRKKSERLPTSKIDSYEFEDATQTKHPKSELLFRAIKTLNDVDKAIVTLHLEDYSNGEISEITGLSKNNVTVKLHRIKGQISKLLKEKEYE